MSDMPTGWKIIEGGLCVFSDGGWCVVAFENSDRTALFTVYCDGRYVASNSLASYCPFSTEHFSLAEKLLRSEQARHAESMIEETYRDDNVTEYRHKETGRIGAVFFNSLHTNSWRFYVIKGVSVGYQSRERTEHECKLRLQKTKKAE